MPPKKHKMGAKSTAQKAPHVPNVSVARTGGTLEGGGRGATHLIHHPLHHDVVVVHPGVLVWRAVVGVVANVKGRERDRVSAPGGRGKGK